MAVTIFSPAKINLYLAVTGQREDGFHNLVSVVAPLDFGDELTAAIVDREGGASFKLECDLPEVPLDESNLILKAARAFTESAGWPARDGRDGVHFRLRKRIPMGAGLGGGSSNAVAALRALNSLSGDLLTMEKLTAIAVKLGSDCALFLHGAPVIIRGRGDQIEVLPETVAKRLRGQNVLLFKPSFGISTPWAYRQMATEAPRHYLPSDEAERRLSGWQEGLNPVSELLFNNMEGVAFDKFIALPVLLAQLKTECGAEPRMSGSGSTCFSLIDGMAPDLSEMLPEKTDGAGGGVFVTRMKRMIRQSWGEDVFIQEASLV